MDDVKTDTCTLTDSEQSILSKEDMFVVVFQDRYSISRGGYIALAAFEELPKSITHNPELIRQASMDMKKDITCLSVDDVIFLLTYEYSYYDAWNILKESQRNHDLFIGADNNPMKAMVEATRKYLQYATSLSNPLV